MTLIPAPARHLSLLLFSLLSSVTLVAQTMPANAVDFRSLDQVVTAELKEKRTPGAVITIVIGDKIVYTKAFGVANVETNAPMQADMLFRLGSTTKMFTAAALVSLSEAGKINLNEPIVAKIKGLSPGLSQTTAHHLLSNSAGIRDFAPTLISQEDAALGQMVRAWKDDVFFAGAGDIYSYSSPGFWLAGFVVEELSGKPYGDAMDDILFKPLGMGRTTLRPLQAMTYPMANGHNVTNDGPPTIIRPFYNNVAQWPAGSIFSNSSDLSRWVIAFLNEGRLEGKQVLSSSLIAQLSKPHVQVPGESDSYYAYGLTRFKSQGVDFVAHGGFSRGYGSMIQMVPARKFAVIVLTNKSGETMRKSLNKATELGLGLKLAEPEKTVTPKAVSDSEMADFVGTYLHAPVTWEVLRREGKLFLKYEGTEYPLIRVADTKFAYGRANENEIVFVPGKSGKTEFIFADLYAARKVAR